MGAVCCCFHAQDMEEYTDRNSSIYRSCPCIRCILQNCGTAYTALFRRGELRALPSSVEGSAALTSTASQDDMSDMYSSPPRPLPYDADLRCFQRGGLLSRREKGSSHMHVESEPLTRSDSDTSPDPIGEGDKCYGSGGGSKECFFDAPLKKTSIEVASGFGCFYSSSEEEDVCPTCLEEYAPENPKIMTRCSHHYHLGCIYEWMERSDSCPVCGKVMEFNETP